MSRLDTTHTVESPEGVTFELRPAGPIVRLLAGAVDLLLRLSIYAGAFVLLACMLGRPGVGLSSIVVFVVEWGYHIYFEMYHDGATPGKHALGLQVLQSDGTAVRWSGSVLRNLVRVADFLPFGYVTGIVSMSLVGSFQRLGDLAGATVVCYRDDTTIPSPGDLPDASPVSTTRRLNEEERRAVVAFAERSSEWSEARRREIASILVSTIDADDPDDAIAWLHGLARTILSGHGSV
jgi:uncharacterized RDD family membrane protein YckC